MGKGIQAIKPSTQNASTVGSVVLKDGTEIAADIVILGVGVKPATDFLKNTALASALQDDGGLKVDQHLRVDGFSDIFAIGD